MARKAYILDTNILMGSPDAIYGFEDNIVVIPDTVLQELDRHKTDIGEPGYNAREAIRELENIVVPGNHAGIINKEEYSLPDGGTLAIAHADGSSILPESYSLSVPDNRILNTAKSLPGKYEGSPGEDIPVILVTNDVSMRLNARSLGIVAQAYKNVRVSTDETYTGRTVIDCTEGNGNKYIESIKERGTAPVSDRDRENLHENEYVVLENGENRYITWYRGGILQKIDPSKYHPMGITPRNAAQVMALHALMAPVEEIPLVILEGPAGTSKTFLSTAAGLDQTFRLGKKREALYNKMIITRNNVLSDEGHGYLPGDLEDKLFPLLAPFYDSLENLFSTEAKGEDPSMIKMQIDDLFANGVIEAASMAYIRGRSLSDTFLILDECQNTTKGQMLTCLTRAAEKTKIVIAGCISQIDSPKLDKYSSGLSHCISCFRDSPLVAQVSFSEEECVRSELSAEASRLLK